MRKCGSNIIRYGCFAAIGLLGLNLNVWATVLTFDSDTAALFGPDTVLQLNGAPMQAGYGSHVSAFDDTTNHFAYGSGGSLTPNVDASYNNASTYETWSVATSNYMTKQYDP